MGKLVVLKLDGDLEQQGFRVTLEIGLEGERPETEVMGQLSPAPELAQSLQQWQTQFDRLGLPALVRKRWLPQESSSRRIKPKEIVYQGSTEQQTIACRQAAEVLRDRMCNWLNSQPFYHLNLNLREELNPDDPIRLLIRTQDTQLRQLPWQEWDFFERYPKAELALSAVEARRGIKARSQTPSGQVRILAILGHNNGNGIDTATDQQLLEALPDAEVTFLIEPRRQEIDNRLWEQPWDILFFAGHGQTENNGGRLFTNPNNSLTLEELKYGLKKATDRGLQLAIFNSCEGLGLVRELDDSRIPQMIVMRQAVPDRVAQEFLKHFLAAFSGGQSFYLAVREARERLQGLEGEFPCASWLPAIYQNMAEVPPTWESIRAGCPPPRFSSLQKHRLRWIALLLLTLGWVGWQFGASRLATVFNNRGFHQYLAGQLIPSQEALSLALRLDPNNRTALYNQGWQCEAVRDFDCARQKYRQAAKLGLAAAHSSLARLDILEQDYRAAVDVLWEGFKLDAPEPVRYSLLKNLGWARLGQGRPMEAEQHLRMAIAIDPDRASGRCLLAQVLESQGEMTESLAEWEICDRYADPGDPDEDGWHGMARERLSIQQPTHPQHHNDSICFGSGSIYPCPG